MRYETWKNRFNTHLRVWLIWTLPELECGILIPQKRTKHWSGLAYAGGIKIPHSIENAQTIEFYPSYLILHPFPRPVFAPHHAR
jgi:hypothetical protein